MESAAFILPVNAGAIQDVLLPGGMIDPDHGNGGQPGQFRVWLCGGVVRGVSVRTFGVISGRLDIYDAVDVNGRHLATGGLTYTISSSGATLVNRFRSGGGDPDSVPPVPAGTVRHDVLMRFPSTTIPGIQARRWSQPLEETLAAAASIQLHQFTDLDISCMNGIVLKLTIGGGLSAGTMPSVSVLYDGHHTGGNRYKRSLAPGSQMPVG